MLQYCKNIFFEKDIWYSKSRSTIFYPEQGNEIYNSVEDVSFWYRHRNDCIATITKNHISKNELFFDIGGGNGYISIRLQNEGYCTCLLEPDIIGVNNAKKRGVKNLICSSFKDAGIVENSLPNVGIFDVLEHIENDDSFLKDIHTSLKPQGKLLLTVPAYSFLWSKEDIHDGHFRRYNKNKLNKKLNNAGFTIVYSSYFFSILPLPILLFRTIPDLFKRDKEYSSGKYVNQNKIENFILKRAMNLICYFEINYIKKAKSLLFGGSILILAKKNNFLNQ